MNIARIMIPRVSTVFLHEKSAVRQGLELMKHHGYTAIPVLDEAESYIGSVSEGAVLRIAFADPLIAGAVAGALHWLSRKHPDVVVVLYTGDMEAIWRRYGNGCGRNGLTSPS